jgi:uncharacterized protein (DUF1697 family)
MARYVALLRGVNLGPRNRVPMAELRALLEELGHEDVATLLQSGNAGLTTTRKPAAVAKELEDAIKERFDVETVVVLRTAKQLEAVLERNPLAGVADDPKRHQVHFLAGKPKAAGVRALEAADVAPERIAVDGDAIHVWHAGGVQRSPASKAIEKADLGVAATARNWSTVEKLLELARG